MKKFTMKNWGVWLLTVIIVAGVADFYVVNFGDGTTSSLSTFLINIGLRAQAFNVALGVVIGHLIVPMYEEGVSPQGLTKWQIAKVAFSSIILYKTAEIILLHMVSK
jgi:hypothetical protein